MKFRILLVVAGLGLIALTALTTYRWKGLTARADLETQIADAQTRLATANLLLDQVQADLARQRRQQSESESMINSLIARMSQTDRQLNDLKNSRSSQPPTTSAQNPILPDSVEPSTVKRNWGPEQATGEPDTFQAGDIPTAWASLEPDAGIQWLKLEYEKPVNLAEVHVRETLNPGAISKIAAVLSNGQEQTIWEGTEPAGTAPVTKMFKAAGTVWTKSVVIYLDTDRVAGWNEIDAVEMVGHDGSRQWASHASASSTYAERPGSVLTQSLR